GYQCFFAYAVSLMINQFGLLFTGDLNTGGIIASLALLTLVVYMLFFKRYDQPNKLSKARA
ncbi:MAG TPA: hypothetical protein PK304_06975, partial [Mobilitalea sp.]|nr:hypothetical protein [Mobilitalea sp.]